MEAWAELIHSHYQILYSAGFDGEKLKNALKHCKWLNVIIGSKGAVKDSINLYVNNCRPKGGKQNVTVTMLPPKGDIPQVKIQAKNGV